MRVETLTAMFGATASGAGRRDARLEAVAVVARACQTHSLPLLDKLLADREATVRSQLASAQDPSASWEELCILVRGQPRCKCPAAMRHQ